MYYFIIFGLSALILAIVSGYVWQALDVKEFPSEGLPAWFVMRVRKPLLAIVRSTGMGYLIDVDVPSKRAPKGPKSGGQ